MTRRSAAAPGMVHAARRRRCGSRRRRRRTAAALPHPARPALRAGATRAASPTGPGVVLLCGRYEGIDQRVIEARGFAGGLDRRLRPLGRRTGGAGRARCRRAPAARRDGRRRERRGRELLPATCWNTPTIPAPPNGRGGACPTCCCPAITAQSPPGAAPRPSGSRANAAPILGGRRLPRGAGAP